VDNRCAIYAIRPFNCSVFPVGSEACLAARESTLHVRDDARA
jgi:Fe-S-cluster containining protein